MKLNRQANYVLLGEQPYYLELQQIQKSVVVSISLDMCCQRESVTLDS
jgi:hypothetical protein